MGKSTAKKRGREGESDRQSQKPEEDSQSVPPPPKKARIEEKRSLFVRSLPSTATSESLTLFFSQHYPVKHATVVVDPKTKAARGYGFVTFADADDAIQAKEKLDNQLLDGRRLRLEVAEPRQRGPAKGNANTVSSRAAVAKKEREEKLAEDRRPPKLIVRNLPWSIKTTEDLTALFRMYGKVKFADLPQSKGKLSGFGFVTLRGRVNAEKAIAGVNGKVVDSRTLAVDWAVDKKTWEQNQAEIGAEGAEMGPSEPDIRGDLNREEYPPKNVDKEDVTEEDADLQAFMANHMENLEDEEGSDDASEADGADESMGIEDEEGSGSQDEPLEEKLLLRDNSTTLFVRNIPFTATDEDLQTQFAQFGPVRYARVVMDGSTGRPAGTGFVCLFNKEDAQACLKGAPRHNPAPSLGKPSVLQDETVDRGGEYTMDGRVLQVTQAVSKDEAGRLSAVGLAARKGQDKDKRRLYLLSEGYIPKDSPLYSALPASEIKIRETSARQRKKQIESNPSLHVSLTRLALRNLPHNLDSKALKALGREAIVGFANDVKEGRRQPLSKEEIARGGAQDKESEHRRREKGRGVVKQAKVIFESMEGSKVAEKIGAGKSRGYGFIEYSSHRWALMGLRWLNGHALQNDAGKTVRLISEFAIENANVVARRRANEERSRNHEQETGSRDNRNARPGNRDAPRAQRGGRPRDAKPAGKPEGKPEGKPAEKGDEEQSKKSKVDTKLAARQQIIGRKRMMRKKKTLGRGGK